MKFTTFALIAFTLTALAIYQNDAQAQCEKLHSFSTCFLILNN